MLNKRLLLFSDTGSFNTQREEIVKILLMNDYPKRLITKYLEREFTVPDVNVLDPGGRVEVDSSRPCTTKYMRIPYIKGLSQQLCRVLKTETVSVVFYQTHTVGRLYSNMKDSVPTDRLCNVVYRLSCDCGAKYVGQSRQYLLERVRQHKYSLQRLLNNKIAPGQHTGVTQHISDNPQHNIHLDRAEVLAIEPNYYKRLMKEAIYIYLTPDNLNLQTDIRENVVSTVYSQVIRRLC